MFFQSWRTNTGRFEHFQIQPWIISSNDHAGNFHGTLGSFPETIILLTTAVRRVAWWSSCSHYQLKPSRLSFCALCLRDLQVWAWVFTYFLPHLKDMYSVNSRQISFQHQLKRHYRKYQLFLVVCLAALLWCCNLPVVFYISLYYCWLVDEHEKMINLVNPVFIRHYKHKCCLGASWLLIYSKFNAEMVIHDPHRWLGDYTLLLFSWLIICLLNCY